ncbi:MAG: hypothetical protein RI572_11690 [Salegentibacter sp.]|uniref:Uncharacterized protein n=1 Tax=Salegentibacter flavus TaxID=287099 RepID=A0A1I5B714_9FLAO|nr:MULTISPECIES: hypothetical protein [Salegentibacter]MDR9458060.1 hypothetical protein [Salegentibacter sp.]SFN70493.1 hypothetical protein SAMN05660413_02222 [Salegentibacter flavus]
MSKQKQLKRLILFSLTKKYVEDGVNLHQRLAIELFFQKMQEKNEAMVQLTSFKAKKLLRNIEKKINY